MYYEEDFEEYEKELQEIGFIDTEDLRGITGFEAILMEIIQLRKKVKDLETK